jgi:hypothetical protein
MKQTVFLFAVCALLISSCKKETFTTDCTSAAKSFAADVSPIAQTTCATSSGCHASGSNKGPGALINYAQISGSKSSIKSQVASGAMPPGNSLTSAQKNAIICWIDAGALNN